jgi:chromosome segregation ATPase
MDSEHRPTTPAERPRLDARTTAWLIAQRERVAELTVEMARLKGHLEASERIERSAQRYADRLEEKLEQGRRREASLARAVGYLEAQRDQLQARLGERSSADSSAALDEIPRSVTVRTSSSTGHTRARAR